MAMFGVPKYDPRAQFAGFGGLPQSMQQPQPGPMAGFGGLTPAMQAGTPPQIDMGKQSGMFAASGRSRPGIDIGQLGAMILAANGNPLGQAAIQAQAHQREQEALLHRQSLLHEQEQQYELQRQMQLRQFNISNPEPTELERNTAALPRMVASGAITQAQADSYRNNAFDPIHWITAHNPTTGGEDIIPYNHNGPIAGQLGGATPPILTDEQVRAHRSQGGASPSNGSGNFPGRR